MKIPRSLAITAILLSSCGVEERSIPEGEAKRVDEFFTVDGYNVRRVRLSDGTSCVIIVNARGSAVSCDWSPPNAR